MLVQPIDSIPPAKPSELTGTIDSTGVVNLSWKANIEDDLLGYRIYKANRAQEELTQITVSPHLQNNFKDSVGIKNLNPKVYYKIIAVDNRYNMSESSEVLTLVKPDVIPPTPPVFTNYQIANHTVLLKWVNSSSEDVAAHYLYRKEAKTPEWKLLQHITDATTTYTDTQIEEGERYSYTLIAKDQNGLESQPAPPVTVIIPKTTLKPKVKGFYAVADSKKGIIDLNWRYKENNIDVFQLYRTTGEKPPRLLKNITPKTNRVVDNIGLTINTQYTYIIRAVFNDGTLSATSKTTVKY